MIAIIEYNAGNSRSVLNALKRLNCEAILTNSVDEIRAADKVIFPGVGEASSAMIFLQQYKIDHAIKSLKQPVLGICLGLQLLCTHSEENNTNGLGIFENRVIRFPADQPVPHVGWNNFSEKSGALFKGIDKQDDMYFVHSYYAEISESTIATSDYILPFSAGLQKDNFYATQFHPEKSGAVGAQLLKNFLEL